MKSQTTGPLATPDLLELLTIDEVEFKRRFAGTPMLRAKRTGLLRNVCVALGNTGDETALAALERSAEERGGVVGEHARWALHEIRERLRTTGKARKHNHVSVY